MGAQLQVFAALVSVLGRLPAPSVLLVDDVHLAGSATIEWLQYAARRLVDLPLLVVCAQRPEEASPLAAGSRVRLGPLDEAAAAEVVGADRAAELVARSGGNPLFLVELAAADPADRLPETVRDAVVARCDRAGSAVAASLRTAALIGSTVELDLLASVVRASPVDLLDHLEEGVRRGLLVEQPAGFAFRHDLIREALESSAGSSRRALVHREAGRILAARPRTDPMAIAYHARLGGDEELAAGALVDAAAVASARFDQQEALRLLEESLSMVESLAGRLLRARVLIMIGDYQRASDEVDAALGMGAGAVALELGAWAAHYRRDFATAVHLADEGARLAEDADQQVGCLIVGGWACQCRGDLRGAERRLEEADRAARGVWRPVTEVWLGGLRVHQGRCDEGAVLIRPATVNEAVGRHGHPALHAYLFAALALGNLGRVEDALAAIAALDAEATRTAAGRWEGRADNVRGWILRGLGDWRAADEANARSLERSTAVGMPEPMAHAHLDLASGALLSGDLDRATSEVGAALGIGDRHAMAWRHRLRARLYRAEIALASGEGDAAGGLAGELLAEARELGIARYQSLAGLLLARARLAGGDTVDLAGVDRILAGLGRVAGLEAWRLTAAVAAAAGVERWWALADTRVAELAAHAGPRASSFQRVAGATLERMRTVGHRA
jgi:tetratricopeptide (TPR) repeat protein